MKNHLLIIDDEENLSFFLKQSLDKEGYTATIANTIAEADEIINRQFPDLLLLDLNLSDGNGLDLYRELRKKEIIIPTIVITAHGSVQSAIDALKMGVDVLGWLSYWLARTPLLKSMSAIKSWPVKKQV